MPWECKYFIKIKLKIREKEGDIMDPTMVHKLHEGEGDIIHAIFPLSFDLRGPRVLTL